MGVFADIGCADVYRREYANDDTNICRTLEGSITA